MSTDPPSSASHSYFYADDEIACARSSIGGVSLLRRTAKE